MPSARLAIVLLLLAGGCAGRGVEMPPPEDAPAPDWAALAAERLPLMKVCELPGSPEPLLCGTFEVPENRDLAAGPAIALNLVLVPAQSVDPPDDAVFVFEGGPGGAATRRAVGAVYAGPVRARDIVLVDQRGTGDSSPLTCAWNPEFEEGALREMYPVADVTACAAEVTARTDPRLYTTTHFADDIEAVRQALGYSAINLRGGSYGTSAMQVFAQRYPDSVRTIFGIGWTSPVRSNLAERGVWTDRTVERLAALCAADAECTTIAPDLGGQLRTLLATLDGSPRRVVLDDPTDPGVSLTVDVGRDWLTEQLRLVLYFAFSSRGLPWAVHRAETDDDWAPLVTEAILIERSFRGSLATGLALTVQCSELMAFDLDAARLRGANTMVGNYRLEQQLQGCAHWPHERVPQLGVAEPRVLPIPTLMLSGALDPVTPPEYADEAGTLLPNHRHLVLPEGQHGPFDLDGSWECVHAMWAELLETADPAAIDTTCSEGMTRPAFVTDAAGFSSYLDEVLIPFAS